MEWPVKLLIGLAAALLAGWIWHGPAGKGESFVAALEAEAQAKAVQSRLPGVSATVERDPLRRTVTLHGAANDLQREGLGSQWGVKDYVRSVKGVGAIRWDDEADAGGPPLLAETLMLVALAYGVGFGLGALLFRRRRRTSYLD
jgi:hypothetical protein